MLQQLGLFALTIKKYLLSNNYIQGTLLRVLLTFPYLI